MILSEKTEKDLMGPLLGNTEKLWSASKAVEITEKGPIAFVQNF